MKVVLVAMIFAVMVVNGAEACHDQDDCDSDECCLYQPLSIFRGGKCKKLAEEGKGCNEEDKNQILGKYVKHCPCKSGLTCEPEEIRDLGIVVIRLNERCVSESSTVQPKESTTVPTTTVTEAPTEAETEPHPVEE